MTNTVQASYAIGIQFKGGGTSTVLVNSNSSVIVNGPINNLQGPTSIVVTGTSQHRRTVIDHRRRNHRVVSGTSVTLIAPGGIGQIGGSVVANPGQSSQVQVATNQTSTTPTIPLPVQIYGGTLTAKSVDNDIAISAVGNLAINEVIVSPATQGNAPQGDIYIAATGDITAAFTFNINIPIVSGRSVEIDLSGGAIGAVTNTNATIGISNINPIVIEATAVPLANGVNNTGLLNSTS